MNFNDVLIVYGINTPICQWKISLEHSASKFKMFKLCIFVAIFAFAATTPVPEAKADPKADPSLIAAAYTAPVVAAPVAYTSAYSAPLAYASYVAPSVYSAGYTAFSPYTGSYVVL
ncbi:uncharacterized protein [Leptinotarsa decemlineata]|uniref:uncharacterized protein n=1 Tax=Leptinotarsa decemlineata TaxID=7539 RepID=UPI003D30ADA4